MICVSEECLCPILPSAHFMKTLTCKDPGGSCDQELSAETWQDMVQTMTKHVLAKHPDVAKQM